MATLYCATMVFLANEKSIFEFFTQPKFSLSSELPLQQTPSCWQLDSHLRAARGDWPANRQRYGTKGSTKESPGYVPGGWREAVRAATQASGKNTSNNKEGSLV